MNNPSIGSSLKVEERRQLLRRGMKAAVFGLPLLAVALTINSSVLMTDAGYSYVHQNNITGELDVFTNQASTFVCLFCRRSLSTTK